MAFFTSKPPSVKQQLKEVLQEQQEPFILDVYLSERRYRKKSFSSNANTGCSHVKSAKNSTRSCGNELKNKSSSIQYASRILRLVSKKLIPTSESQKPLNCNGVVPKEHNADFIGGTVEKFSAASNGSSKSIARENSSSGEQNSGSSSSATNTRASKPINYKEVEAASDTNLQQDCMKENKKFRTVPVPKDKPFKEDSLVLSRFHRTRSPEDIPSVSSCCTSPKSAKGDAIFSACLWELIRCTLLTEKQNHVGDKEPQDFVMFDSSQHIKIIRVLQQKKQLLFDCIKEATEIHRWKFPQDFLGPEELGKIICGHISSWVMQSGDATNIVQLIHSDLYEFTEEWSDFQLLSRKIGIEIGNAIMDEIIMEVIDLYLQ